MSEVSKIINWGEAEIKLLFAQTPEVVKKYEAEILHVGNTIKAALSSPTAEAIEAALQQLFPGTWEQETITIVENALGVALPEIAVLESSTGTVIGDVAQLVKYLQGLTPKMQNSGVLKTISALLQAIDPSLTEVAADTAAQITYAKSTIATS